jgi:hypothetical protein
VTCFSVKGTSYYISREINYSALIHFGSLPHVPLTRPHFAFCRSYSRRDRRAFNSPSVLLVFYILRQVSYSVDTVSLKYYARKLP